MDCELNMRVHIGKISSFCFYHLRRLRQLRNIMSSAIMQRLLSAFFLSRLDYCNPVLAGLPACCYSKTVAESYERGSSSSRRTWLERSHHTSNARSALAADHLSNKIQTLYPVARSSEQQSPRYLFVIHRCKNVRRYDHSLQAVTSYHDQRRSSAREPSAWLDPQRGTNCRRSGDIFQTFRYLNLH